MRNLLIDLIFPERCINCRDYAENETSPYVCPDCFKSIEINSGFECIGCRTSVSQGQTCYLCRGEYSVDKLFVVLDYRQPIVEKSLKALKYKFIPDVSVGLSLIAMKYLDSLTKKKGVSNFDNHTTIMPVPLYPRRYRWRGFNQSELIAQNIASRYLLNFNNSSLIRKYPSPPQADIEDREMRLNNVKNCFSAVNPESVKNKNIILVDDICTTGATFNECAKVLKSAGTKSVTAIAIARG